MRLCALMHRTLSSAWHQQAVRFFDFCWATHLAARHAFNASWRRASERNTVVQDCDIYLLDDVLAAVDAHVAAWLTTHALTGPMLDAKTRVVCSNASLITVVADQTMRLYKGKVLSSDMSAKLGGSDEAVRGGMSVRGSRGQPSPLSIALGLAGKSLMLRHLAFMLN